jgi:hypothetical protein
MSSVDRWHQMAQTLAGEPPPPAPALRGRVHRAPPVTDGDPYAAAWDERTRPATLHDTEDTGD